MDLRGLLDCRRGPLEGWMLVTLVQDLVQDLVLGAGRVPLPPSCKKAIRLMELSAGCTLLGLDEERVSLHFST